MEENDQKKSLYKRVILLIDSYKIRGVINFYKLLNFIILINVLIFRFGKESEWTANILKNDTGDTFSIKLYKPILSI